MNMRFPQIPQISLSALIILSSLLYIINEYGIPKLQASSLKTVIDRDNNIIVDIHDYSSWSEEKKNKFLQIKAAQYEERGAQINQYCNLQVTLQILKHYVTLIILIVIITQ